MLDKPATALLASCNQEPAGLEAAEESLHRVGRFGQLLEEESNRALQC